MGIIGRWIDSLDDASRDRIIEHPDPSYVGWWWWDDERVCGCLVGCVIGEALSGMPDAFIRAREGTFDFSREGRMEFNTLCDVGDRFPELTERFTPQRMWRVVKARAAARNRIALPAPVHETVPA